MARRTRWLVAAAACIAVPLAALAAVTLVIDPNTFKTPLIQAVGDATGRTLSLDGPLRIRWSLWPTLQVNDVRLANIPGGSRPDMARAERIEARISLLDLLWRRLEVQQLTLTGPNILFETVNGRSNWIFDTSTAPSTAPSAASGDASGDAAPQSVTLRIRDAQVINGMVTIKLPNRTNVIGLRSVTVRHEQDGGPLDLAGLFVYGDNQPFSLKASAVPTAGLHDPWTTRLAFDAFDTAATGSGTMTIAGDYDLTLDVHAGALERLNALYPAMQLPVVHGVALSAHVVSGPALGSLPTVGPATLSFEEADLRPIVAGLQLGKTQMSLPNAGGLAAVQGQGRYAGLAFTMRGSAGVPVHPEDASSLPIDLAWTVGANRLAAKGKLAVSALQFAGLDAQVSAQAPALAAIRPAGWAALPALTDVRFSGQVIVPADAGSVRLRGATLTSAAGDVAGDAAIGGKQGFEARLRSDRLDADALLTAFGAGPAAQPGANGPMIPDTRLPWAIDDTLASDVTLDAGVITFGGQEWRNLALGVKFLGGKRSATMRMALPNSTLQMSVAADATVRSMPVSLSIHAPALPLSLLAAHAGLPGPVSGSARVEAELHGAGVTVRQLAASLDGPISIATVGARINNAAFRELAGGALQALSIAVPAQGNTDLRCLGLVGTFAQGVLRLRTIALESTYLSLEGAGQIDLGHETVALKLHPLVQVGGSPVAVPVIVEGPFRAVGGRLDASGLDKLGLFIDGLFGGDKPEACSNAGLVPAGR